MTIKTKIKIQILRPIYKLSHSSTLKKIDKRPMDKNSEIKKRLLRGARLIFSSKNNSKQISIFCTTDSHPENSTYKT